MATHELTLKNYQKQLKDNLKAIYDNFMDILKTRTEHVNFEVQVKSAEIVRSYQSLMQLVSEIRTFLIINDLVGINQAPAMGADQGGGTFSQQQQQQRLKQATTKLSPAEVDDKLVRLRDEMSMFLYELEIPLP